MFFCLKIKLLYFTLIVHNFYFIFHLLHHHLCMHMNNVFYPLGAHIALLTTYFSILRTLLKINLKWNSFSRVLLHCFVCSLSDSLIHPDTPTLVHHFDTSCSLQQLQDVRKGLYVHGTVGAGRQCWWACFLKIATFNTWIKVGTIKKKRFLVDVSSFCSNKGSPLLMFLPIAETVVVSVGTVEMMLWSKCTNCVNVNKLAFGSTQIN